MNGTEGLIAGGVVSVALAAFKMVDTALKKRSNGAGNGVHAVNCPNTEEIKEIGDWFAPRGPMDRMTKQMEDLNEGSREQTGVLKAIHIELQARNGDG